MIAINNNDISPAHVDTSFYSGTLFETFKPVTERLVRQVIQKSVPKACDHHPIPTTLLCENLDVLWPTITNIMNHSLTSGTVPFHSKTAIVKPLLKKPSLDQDALSSYRPITSLPLLSKILEKIVLHQLLAHLMHTISKNVQDQSINETTTLVLEKEIQ